MGHPQAPPAQRLLAAAAPQGLKPAAQLHRVASRCTVLQRAAPCCNALHHAATRGQARVPAVRVQHAVARQARRARECRGEARRRRLGPPRRRPRRGPRHWPRRRARGAARIGGGRGRLWRRARRVGRHGLRGRAACQPAGAGADAMQQRVAACCNLSMLQRLQHAFPAARGCARSLAACLSACLGHAPAIRAEGETRCTTLPRLRPVR